MKRDNSLDGMILFVLGPLILVVVLMIWYGPHK